MKYNIQTITPETMETTLNKLLTNETFHENANRLSNLAKDQPVTSLESIIWWTEYLIRKKGAKHLHAKGKTVPLDQYYLMDILLVTVILTAMYQILKKAFGLAEIIFSTISQTLKQHQKVL